MALSGIKILDLTRVLAGPYCTQLLSDLGARVIKLELPKLGDETRTWGPPWVKGMSTYFGSVNRNKESVAVDLRREEGRDVLNKLILDADVLVHNYLPDKEVKLGEEQERREGREERSDDRIQPQHRTNTLLLVASLLFSLIGRFRL